MEGLLAVSEWPKYDEGKTIAKTVEIGVQVNGKVRGTIVIPNGCEKEKAFEIAKADERIASFLEGKEPYQRDLCTEQDRKLCCEIIETVKRGLTEIFLNSPLLSLPAVFLDLFRPTAC